MVTGKDDGLKNRVWKKNGRGYNWIEVKEESLKAPLDHLGCKFWLTVPKTETKMVVNLLPFS